MIAEAVHTTGVNWDGVLANVASITVILVAFGTGIVRSVRRSIKHEIHSVVQNDVTPTLERIQGRLDGHDTRLARLEGMEEGKRQAIAQTALSKP